MRIGIMGAMFEEITRLKQQMHITSTEKIGKKTIYLGSLQGQQIALVFSGWGKVAAASTATLLIERYHVTKILFTGVAGGVDEKLNIGDIIISHGLVQHDMDCAGVMGIQRFEVPLVGLKEFIADFRLQQLATKAAHHYLNNDLRKEIEPQELNCFNIENPMIYSGLIASGDQFITSQSKLQMLREALPDLLAVEMEGAAVAQVAHAYDLPFVVIRTISDKADDHAMIDFPRFLQQIASHFTAGIIMHCLKQISSRLKK
jgi:adenosylhomocysteine nucleosidase